MELLLDLKLTIMRLYTYYITHVHNVHTVFDDHLYSK